MKKTIITISIVLLFTLFFVLVFRYTSGAESVDIEGGESSLVEQTITPNEDETLESNTQIESTETETQVAEGIIPSDDNLVTEEKFNINVYLREKIAPVAVGVATAVLTVLASLYPVIKAIIAIIGSFSKKDEERNKNVKESNEQIIKNVERIESSVKTVPELEKIIKKQNETINILSEIMVLGFSSNSEVVRAGKGKKMTLLLNKLGKGEEE